MDLRAVDGDAGGGGVEGLPADLAVKGTVHGIGPRCPKGLDVEEVGAVADLLVGDEGQLERGMGQLGVVLETCGEGYDLGDAGLVVCREERRAIGHDDVVAHELVEDGGVLGRGLDDLAVHDAGDQVAPLVVDDVRMHVKPRGVGRGVDVGEQTQGRQMLAACGGGHGCRHIGMLVGMGIREPQLDELGLEEARHVMLALRRGYDAVVVWVGWRADLHIAQESLEDIAHGPLRSQSV